MPQGRTHEPNEAVILANECGRGCCIIDTKALIDLCRIELSGRLAIEWVLQDFCVLIPKTIFDEGCPYASFTSYANLYFSKIKTFMRTVSEGSEDIIDTKIDRI